MGKAELLRRYMLFGLSLLVIAFGISIITRSDLGTSPISSIPYVASLNTRFTMGTYFFLFTVFLICIQLLLLGRNGVSARKTELLMQFPVAVCLSLFTDLTMWLLSDFAPVPYFMKIVSLIFGCLVLAFGICLEVLADVTMISAEYTIQFAAIRFRKEFGWVKVVFDVSLVVLAILCSLAFSGRIEGVREGTVIAALITGPFVRVIMPRLGPVRRWLLEDKGESPQEPSGVPSTVITISREYGSGGHFIGEMLAKELGFAFYDKELISMVAAEGHFTEEFVARNEQKPASLLYRMIMQDYEAPLDKSLSRDDALFVAQSRVIRRIASQGSCVIVGRCADYILKDCPNAIHLFLYAGLPQKVKRVTEEYGISPGEAPGLIEETDRGRKEHYYRYTGQLWGDARNYLATFDTGRVGCSEIVDFVKGISTRR